MILKACHFFVSQVTETRTGPLGCSNYDSLDSVSSVLVHSPENKIHLKGEVEITHTKTQPHSGATSISTQLGPRSPLCSRWPNWPFVLRCSSLYVCSARAPLTLMGNLLSYWTADGPWMVALTPALPPQTTPGNLTIQYRSESNPHTLCALVIEGVYLE